MTEKEEKNELPSIDDILKGALKEQHVADGLSLKERFEKRVKDLNIKQTTVLDILSIEWRALNGILDGTQTRVDFTALIKLARFLGIENARMIELYMLNLETRHKEEMGLTKKAKFIQENFDLGALLKAGVIDNINDFDHIELQLLKLLGLKSLTDYNRRKIDTAFSTAKLQPKNTLTRDFWIRYAYAQFECYDNGHEYNKDVLVEYFPEIRQYSMNPVHGLAEVIRALYKIGITVIFQPSFPTLHLRGATFAVKNKPCVVLTDYKGFYPTLWFALIHELYHVLFDWEEISTKTYHLSDEDSYDYSVIKKEQDANNFAREYLFSHEKMSAVQHFLHNEMYISEFARKNHIHPSIIYVFNAFDKGEKDFKAWPRARAKMPAIAQTLEPLYYYKWAERKPATEVADIRKQTIFNHL